MSADTAKRSETEKVLLSPDEVALALGISRSQLYKMFASGDILSVKVGRLRKIPVAEVDRFVARLLAQAEQP